MAAPALDGKAEDVEQLRRIEHDRLYPRITNPNWLVLRSRREIFRQWLHDIVTCDAAVLDVGGRVQPYRELISHLQVSYFSVDLRRTGVVDVAARAEQLPLPDASFDVVLCTQMLEYAPDPSQVIAEIHRVLKPGGHLLLSVPSLAIRDADEDAWRFWPAALRHLLRDFTDVTIAPETGSIAGLFRTINVGITTLAKYPLVRAIINWTVVPALNLVGLALSNLVHSNNDAMAVNYSVLARK